MQAVPAGILLYSEKIKNRQYRVAGFDKRLSTVGSSNMNSHKFFEKQRVDIVYNGSGNNDRSPVFV